LDREPAPLAEQLHPLQGRDRSQQRQAERRVDRAHGPDRDLRPDGLVGVALGVVLLLLGVEGGRIRVSVADDLGDPGDGRRIDVRVGGPAAAVWQRYLDWATAC